MADFLDYFPVLRANEGGYCHNPNDTGGETYRGIARNPNPQWNGWPVVDAIKNRLYPVSPVPQPDWLPLSEVLEADATLGALVVSFYKSAYWDALSLDQVASQSVADQVADHGVNAGVKRAGLLVQFLLTTEFGARLALDGCLGRESITALNAVAPSVFYARFVALRQAFYSYLADDYAPAATPVVTAWYNFFSTDLHIGPDKQRQEFLASWLSRTRVPFVA